MEGVKYHEPVLVREVIENLAAPLNSKKVIDATLGSAGHSLALTENGFEVLGIETDPEILVLAKKRIKGEGIKAIHGNFREIKEIAQKNGFEKVANILFDLGVSNIHLKSSQRGFSFGSPEAPLDMRLDPKEQGLTASDLINFLREDQLVTLFSKVLKYFQARGLACEIIRKRQYKKIETVGDFLKVCQVIRGKAGLNPATLPLLALRMAVNSELENLKETLPDAFSLLVPSGRLLIITFHSEEERIVKDFFFEAEREGLGKVLTKKSIVPNNFEVEGNPSSRSAELWILEKIK
jgi:16S rRNA (cytosine1402-N4)-methyltransferase